MRAIDMGKRLAVDSGEAAPVRSPLGERQQDVPNPRYPAVTAGRA